jgi:hypothetical protein
MNTTNTSITRREALKTVAVTALGAGLTGRLAAQDANAAKPAPAPVFSKPTLHVYPDYGWLRGLGVIPSWAARIEDAWWFYDGARMREEVALAKQIHINCIRLWIEFTAWMRDPDKVTANFMDAVAAIAESGMKVMPCLFNRWHDPKFDYGGTYNENLHPGWTQPREYVRALVTPLAKDDRVLVWDLCNEPRANDSVTGPNKLEVAWLTEIAATVRTCGAQQPLIIGTKNSYLNQPGYIETYAPVVDVLCAHPYVLDRKSLETLIGSYRALREQFGKPLLVNETIPGALDDLVRADVVRYYTEQLSAAGFGWMGWVIREGKAISTRRDRYDGNGINGQGFHPFFTKESKLRGGLEFLTEKPTLRAPWEKA